MKKLTPWDFAYAADVTIACCLSYAIITQVLARWSIDPLISLVGCGRSSQPYLSLENRAKAACRQD
jgi:hypothetical protein